MFFEIIGVTHFSKYFFKEEASLSQIIKSKPIIKLSGIFEVATIFFPSFSVSILSISITKFTGRFIKASLSSFIKFLSDNFTSHIAFSLFKSQNFSFSFKLYSFFWLKIFWFIDKC